jgi:hypothetical protein
VSGDSRSSGLEEEQAGFAGSAEDDEDLFGMANLRPERTGLPFVVFISQRGGARHDVRVKVATGPRPDPAAMVTVALRPEPRIVAPGELPADDFRRLVAWLALNRQALVDYWNGEIAYTEDVFAVLRKLGA